MTTVSMRLDRDLRSAGARLRQLGRGAAVDERHGAIGDNSPGADALEGSQSTTTHEIGWTTREMLVERIQRLSAALERLREDTYGVCVECGEPIATARLQAMPEVETCVACQSGLERRDRQTGRSLLVGRLAAMAQSGRADEGE